MEGGDFHIYHANIRSTGGLKIILYLIDIIHVTFSDTANAKLMRQENQQKDNHDEILRDLATIREKAKQVWEKLGEKFVTFFFASNLVSFSLFSCCIFH